MKCFSWKIFVCKLCIPYQTFVSIERRRTGLFISHPPSFLLPILKARMRPWIVLLSSTLLGYFVSNKFTAMQRTKESWIGLSVLCRWFTLLSLNFFKFEQLECIFWSFAPILFDLITLLAFLVSQLLCWWTRTQDRHLREKENAGEDSALPTTPLIDREQLWVHGNQ